MPLPGDGADFGLRTMLRLTRDRWFLLMISGKNWCNINTGWIKMNLLTSISKSLAAKLIIALVLLIIIGEGISWYR
jgi:hypothetical protein